MKLRTITIFTMATALFLAGCSSKNESANWVNLDRATNYPMPLCPESDKGVVNTESDLPATVLPCLGHDGNVNLAGLPKGKPLVVSLWASWCVICEDDAPAFIAAKTKYKDLNFIGINYQDKESAAIASAAKWNLPFASVVDSATVLQGFYQVVGLPITVIYDEEGKTIGRINGPIGTPEEFIEYLDKVLKN